MITVESVSKPADQQCKKRGKIILGILLYVIVAVIFSIWYFGSPKPHQEKSHVLYSSFDSSPEHKKLIAGLTKAKSGVLVGKKADGLVNFVEHYANKLIKNGQNVYIEEFGKNSSSILEWAKDVTMSAVGVGNESVWLIVSEEGLPVPESEILDIQANCPNSKIIIVTTKAQKIKGFKAFTFSKLNDKIVNQAITKAFGVKQNIIDILNDHHETHEELLNGLEVTKFDTQEILQDSYISFEGLSKDGAKQLKDLCKSGALKLKKGVNAAEGLEQYGVIFTKNTLFWADDMKIFNYELFSGVNCKEKVISESDLKSLKEQKEKEAKKKELEEAKKQQEEAKKQAKLQQAEEKKQAKLKQAEQKKQASKASKGDKKASKTKKK